ncbi:MAG: DUF2905 domain-containing protein, partial [Chloroflexi bacterium]|nr:DUF2905 domain-containing protein [Chloroflexota bacterium]
MQWNPIARLLIISGIALIVLGLLWQFGARFLPFLGRLPGDIVIERGNVRFYLPITTMILASIVLSLLFTLVARFLN